MIEVYAFATPNSLRIPIMLEELNLPYDLKPVNVRKGEQKLAEHLALNPNGKVPVLVDPDGPGGERLVLTESGAILIYLAEKTGRLLPAGGVERARVLEQMFFHLTGIGPMFGQAGYFQKQAPEQLPIALTRFNTEVARVMTVFDGVLGEHPFAAGSDFTIADIAHFGWIWRRAFADVELETYPNVKTWYERVSSRPAVERAIQRVTALVPQD
jgi:glutathione S-transferase